MKRPLHAPSPYAGAIIAHAPGGALIGWATNPDHPEQNLWLEILGDGETLELVCANVMLNALPDEMPPEAQGHAFIAHIGKSRQQGIGRLDVRIANSTHTLKGSLLIHAADAGELRQIVGHVENRGGLKCWGWAQDASHPQHTLKVQFYRNGQWLGETLADQYRYDYEENTSGHGFEFTLPDEFADGQLHRIEVMTETHAPLMGSPLTVFMPREGITHWLCGLSTNEQTQPILKHIGQQHAFYRSLSLNFKGYSAWFKRYGHNPHPIPSSDLSFLIALYGDGNAQATLDSLEAQQHPHWRAVRISPDQSASSTREWPKVFAEHQGQANSLVLALQAGDTLEPTTLALMAAAFADDRVGIVYSDVDILQPDGSRLPWFKPDWDPDLALHQPLLHGFATRSRNLLLESTAHPDAWPWQALTRLSGRPASQIHHLPWVLLHQSQPADTERFRTQADAWLTTHTPGINIEHSAGKTHIHWPEPAEWPTVSLIIPTRDKLDLLKPCLDSLLATDYPHLELIVVDNDSTDPATLRYLKGLPRQGIRCLHHHGPFNFATINNRAIDQAQGTLIGLINNDIEALDTHWLKEMVTTLLRPDVAAVGAKLLWPNGMVQHGGVVLGLHGLAGHIANQWHAHDAGYFGLNQSLRTASAVTAACLLCRRDDYLAVGGLDEHQFAVNFNDVDFCLQLQRQTGRRIVWTPHAVLQHAESASRGKDELPSRRARLHREQKALFERWTQWILDDPYYNPNLNLDHYSHEGPAIPPRDRHRDTASQPLNPI